MQTHEQTAAHAGPYEIVILAASAGGIEALQQVLSRLPADFPVPVVVVLHHAPGRTAIVVRLLAARTALQVRAAVDGAPLLPGVAYIAPADRHMSVSGSGTIESSNGRRINFLRSSAEPLLESVVSLFASRAIAVVLTGTGRNGARGAKALHDAGGVVIAQDRESSQHFGMPGAAIAAGAVDRILPLPEIGPTLMELMDGKHAEERSVALR